MTTSPDKPRDSGDKPNANNFSVLSYANGFTVWHYRASTRDALSGVHYEPIREWLREGDEIVVNFPGMLGTFKARGHVSGFTSLLIPVIEWEYISPVLITSPTEATAEAGPERDLALIEYVRWHEKNGIRKLTEEEILTVFNLQQVNQS